MSTDNSVAHVRYNCPQNHGIMIEPKSYSTQLEYVMYTRHRGIENVWIAIDYGAMPLEKSAFHNTPAFFCHVILMKLRYNSNPNWSHIEYFKI